MKILKNYIQPMVYSTIAVNSIIMTTSNPTGDIKNNPQGGIQGGGTTSPGRKVWC